MLYRDRPRAQSFGTDAARYDRARPSYPAPLVDALLESRPQRALDVGCGTGKAARLLAARGCAVLGVEPDERMAEVARSYGIPVEVTTFEDWDPAGRRFDLVASGQAWHWVDPVAGLQKAAAVLAPGGHFAVFWNVGSHDLKTQAALDDAYKRYAAGLVKGYMPIGQTREGNHEHIRAIAASGFFAPPELRSFHWERRHSKYDWLDQLGTHSDHLMLPAEQYASLLEAVGRVIDRLGGSLTVHYQTDLILARR